MTTDDGGRRPVPGAARRSSPLLLLSVVLAAASLLLGGWSVAAAASTGGRTLSPNGYYGVAPRPAPGPAASPVAVPREPSVEPQLSDERLPAEPQLSDERLPAEPLTVLSAVPPPDDDALQVADPIRVLIPSIEVDAAVGPLDLTEDGSLDVPSDFDATGWWRNGPEPGEPGASVIAGHVDDWQGPAVFYLLHQLTVDDVIVIERADGTSARFQVTRSVMAAKDAFPTDEVYGPTAGPELRLITCGGRYDRRTKSYRDNLVVFARLTP